MAILKCEHCKCTKEIPSQYAGKTVKCPSCNQPTQIHDTIDFLTSFSDKLFELETQLKELQTPPVVAPTTTEVNEELLQVLSKMSRDHRIAMTEFNEATKRRDNITQHTEKRTNYLFRLIFFSLLLIVAVSLFFIFQLTHSFKETSQSFLSVHSDIKSINQHLVELKSQFTGNVTNNTGPHTLETSQNVAKMQASVDIMQDKIGKMTDDISYLADQVEEFMKNESNSFKYRYYRP